MAVIKNVTIAWDFPGDTGTLSGFDVRICLAHKEPEDVGATIASGTASSASSSTTLNNVSLEVGTSYKAWVRSSYGTTKGHWIATGATFTPDFSGSVDASEVTEMGFSHKEGGENGFTTGTHTNTESVQGVVSLSSGQNTGNWESPEHSLALVTDLSTSDVRWTIKRDDYYHDYVAPTTQDGLRNNDDFTVTDIDTDIYMQRGRRIFSMKTYESGDENQVKIEVASASETKTTGILDYKAKTTASISDVIPNNRTFLGSSFQGSGGIKFQDKMYFFGGYGGSLLADCVVTDLAGKTIETISMASVGGRYTHVNAIWNGKIYLFYGYKTATTNEVVEFDPFNKTFTLITTDTNKPSSRSNVVGGIIGNYFYLFGGYVSGAVSELWRRDMTTGVWTQLTSAGTAVYQPVCWTYNNKLYFFGGITGTGSTATNVIQIYNTTNSTWETTLTLHKISARGYCGYAITDHDSVLIYGGLLNATYYDDFYELFFDDLSINKFAALSGVTARQGASCWYADGYFYISNGYNASGGYKSETYRRGPFDRNEQHELSVVVPGRFDISVKREGGQNLASFNPKCRVKAEWVSATGAEYLLSNFRVYKRDGTTIFDGSNATNLLANGTASNVKADGNDLSNDYTHNATTYYYPRPSTYNTAQADDCSTGTSGFWFYAKIYLDGSTYKGGVIFSGYETGTTTDYADGWRFYVRYDTGISKNVVEFTYDKGADSLANTLSKSGALVSGWNEILLTSQHNSTISLIVNNTTAATTSVYAETMTFTTSTARWFEDRLGTYEAFTGTPFREIHFHNNYSTAPSPGRTTLLGPGYGSVVCFSAEGAESNITTFDVHLGGSYYTTISCNSFSTATQAYNSPVAVPEFRNGSWESNEIAVPYVDLDSCFAQGQVSNTTYVKLYVKKSEDGTTWSSYVEIPNNTPKLCFPDFVTYKWFFSDISILGLQEFVNDNYLVETNIYNGTSWLGWKTPAVRSTIPDVNNLSLVNIANCKYKFRVSFTRDRFGGEAELMYVSSRIGYVKAFASESGATNDSLWRHPDDYLYLDGGMVHASSRITVGDSNIIIDGKSDDNRQNAIYVAPDGGPGGLTGFGGAAQDYVKLHSGDIEFFYAVNGEHYPYKSLQRLEYGTAFSNVWQTLSGYWKAVPKIMVYPSSVVLFDVDYVAQTQIFSCNVTDIEEYPIDSKIYRFKVEARTDADPQQTSIIVGTTYNGSVSEWESAFNFTVTESAKTIKINISNTNCTDYYTYTSGSNATKYHAVSQAEISLRVYSNGSWSTETTRIGDGLLSSVTLTTMITQFEIAIHPTGTPAETFSESYINCYTQDQSSTLRYLYGYLPGNPTPQYLGFSSYTGSYWPYPWQQWTHDSKTFRLNSYDAILSAGTAVISNSPLNYIAIG